MDPLMVLVDFHHKTHESKEGATVDTSFCPYDFSPYSPDDDNTKRSRAYLRPGYGNSLVER